MAAMLMSVSDEHFIDKHHNQSQDSQHQEDLEDSPYAASSRDPPPQTMKAYTKQEMLRFLNRVLDRNKPLFLFNSRMNPGGGAEHEEAGTPSFSVITLIEKSN